jgi:sec-independent protein translocase protein TatA
MPIGATELIIILVIVLVLFGAKRLPELGRSLGGGMREFKDSVTGKSGDDEQPQIEPAATADVERPATPTETTR